MTSDKSPARKERFEDHLKQVEDVVKALESGKLGLEESLEKYEAGIAALKHCYRILEDAEKRIQVLVKEKDGSLGAKDYSPAAESKPARRKAAAPPDSDDVPF